MKKFIFLPLAFCLSGLVHAAPEPTNPVGERARYVIDTKTGRTSNLIRSGTFELKINKFLPDTEIGPAYQASATYNVRVILIGTKTGTEVRNLEQEIFAPNFFENLRAGQEFHGSMFKAKHLGYRNAVTLGGQHYDQCDYIYLWDIIAEESSFFGPLLRAVIAAESGISEDLVAMDNANTVKVWVHAKPGLPALGGVKLDIQTVYNGRTITIGADLQR